MRYTSLLVAARSLVTDNRHLRKEPDVRHQVTNVRAAVPILLLAGVLVVPIVPASAAMSLTVGQATVTPGGATTVRGRNFVGTEQVVLTLDGAEVASDHTNQAGEFSVNFTVPIWTALGHHRLAAGRRQGTSFVGLAAADLVVKGRGNLRAGNGATSPSPSPTELPTPTPTPTATPTADPAATSSSGPSATPAAAPSTAPTGTATPVSSVAPSASPTPVSTASPTPMATHTATPAPTATPLPTAAPTATPTMPTPTSTPTPTAITPSGQLLVSRTTLASLPTSGTPWTNLKRYADATSTPNLADQESANDVQTFAAALVYARTGDTAYRSKVITNLRAAMGTEAGGRTLALARNLPGYVLAADLISLSSADSSLDATFRSWLRSAITRTLSDGRNVIRMQGEQGNNWGAHATSALAATYAYLGDRAGLDHVALVLRGFLGDADAWYGWRYHQALSWAVGAKPTPINPAGATKDGHSVDGVIQQDQVRGCGFTWPACKENYAWESLQGLVLGAELMSRQGYDAWNWSNRAIYRSVNWLVRDASYPAEGDDTWIPWLVNRRYGSSFPTTTTRPGKNFGFTDWLYR